MNSPVGNTSQSPPIRDPKQRIRTKLLKDKKNSIKIKRGANVLASFRVLAEKSRDTVSVRTSSREHGGPPLTATTPAHFQNLRTTLGLLEKWNILSVRTITRGASKS